MTLKNIIIYIVLILFLLSCGVLPSDNYSFKQLESDPQLGAIGTYKDGLVKNDFVEIGIPELTGNLSLAVKEVDFNSHSLRAYNKKIMRESDSLRIVDSLNLIPSYVVLEIRDRIGYVEALNNKENRNLNEFLKVTNNNRIITKVYSFFPSEISNELLRSIEVYLGKDPYGAYFIETLDLNNNREKYYFKQGVTFGYEFSDICWIKDYKGNAQVRALKAVNEVCPGKTKRNPEKFDEEDVFEKI